MAEFVRINGVLREMPAIVAAESPEIRAAWCTDPDGVEAKCQAAETARVAALEAEGQPTTPRPLDQDAVTKAAAAHAAELEQARARPSVSSTDTPIAGAAPVEE